LGGSFGVALITTFVSRRNELHRVDLVSKLDTNNPAVMNRVSGMTASFAAKGMDTRKAVGSAYQSLEYSVMKQSVVMSYMDVFLYLGLMFLICVPFVLMVKGSKKTKLDPSAMH